MMVTNSTVTGGELCDAIRGCNVRNNRVVSPSELVDLCSRKPGYYCPPPKCNECGQLTAENTVFYQ
ncbi:hypothetical protein LSH36_243g03005, partial [Paralvinella palmiformis]